MRVGPFFKWFGSKWSMGKILPPPECSEIIEPFAGGAGYACNYADRSVTLFESNTNLQTLWLWLIGPATEADVRVIPLDVPEGTDIRTLGLSHGQAMLLKHWQRTNNVGNCWTISPWGNKPGQFTANTRARVAEEISAVKHWRFEQPTWDRAATWLIDPPYFYNYDYGVKGFDFDLLARLTLGLPAGAQVIACEARCPKTDRAPTYLPFVDLASRVTSRRKQGEHTHSKELIYHRGRS